MIDDMIKQLELSKEELENIGFTEKYEAADRDNPERTYYTIPTTNAEFIYNVGCEPYKLYFRTKIGDAYNSNWLDITKIAELYILLSCFQVKYNFIMF
jgi:hypothetical protein